MKSNLPLLFVNGFPSSLSKMTVCELERFIPFMVQCSLGNEDIKECAMPKWWPKDIPYPKAFVKYNQNDNMWRTKLQNLIISCYSYHDCNYLLHFCTDLAKHPKSVLKFVNNWDSTTSIYNKATGKLLVTFRNENILYDKIIPARKRKWLKPHVQNPDNNLLDMLPSMVEEDPSDIYLCDKCDVVLYSYEEMKEHESKCGIDIITTIDSQHPPKNSEQETFLNYFSLSGLQTCDQNVNKICTIKSPIHIGRKPELRSSIPHALLKCPAIPFSSPAGIFIAKRSRHTFSDQQHAERRERTERYCEALPLSKTSFNFVRAPCRTYPVTFRKPCTKWTHSFTNPKEVGKRVLSLNSQLKYLNCKSISVKLKCNCDMYNTTNSEIKSEIINLCSSDEEDSAQSCDCQLITPTQS